MNIFLEVGGEVQCSSHALETLTCFRPKFNLCRNNVAGFYLQNVWKTPVEEWSLYLKKANSTHWIFSMVFRIWNNLYIITTPWKVSVFRLFWVCIFPHSDTFLHTPYLPVFSSNAGKYQPKKNSEYGQVFKQCMWRVRNWVYTELAARRCRIKKMFLKKWLFNL